MHHPITSSVRRARLIPLVVAVAVFVIAAAATMSAHDFWMEPSSFHPKSGSLLGLRLLVGQNLIGDPVPREPAAIERFVVARGSDEIPVPGRDGADPAGIVRVDGPGLFVIGYQSRPREIELTREKFEQYLGEEGLDAVKRLISLEPTMDGARELFSRHAKALVLSGPVGPLQSDRVLGLPLELVAEKNPFATQPLDDLPIVLRYQGKPLAGALVVALSRRNPSIALTARSDRSGRVVFKLPVSGPWLVKSVHMIAAQPGTHADWESFWASLTFDVGASGASATR